MKEFEIKNLEDAYSSFSTLREKIDFFHDQARVQLLGSQFQLFQSLATIMLALIAVVIATTPSNLNFYFSMSTVFTVSLLFYVVTNTRENIDIKDKSFRDTEELFKKEIAEIRKKIEEVYDKDDYNEWINFLKQKRENPILEIKKPLSYAGEIAVFLFFNGLLFAGIAIVFSYNDSFLNIKYQEILLSVIVVCSSFLLSMLYWNTYITEKISKLLDFRW